MKHLNRANKTGNVRKT